MLRPHTSTDKRNAARVILPIPIRIELREDSISRWREITKPVSISNIGAGFYSIRKMEIGRLLHLQLPMPRQMRFYDELEPQYEVCGIIRHCHPRSLMDSSVYHVGVAFIGKEPPESYKMDPLITYQLGDLLPKGLWRINENENLSCTRRSSRYSIPIEVFIAQLDEEKNMIKGEKTVTENISINGASVFSGLDVNVGEYIKFVCDRHQYSGTAVVRSRRIGEDNLPRLHVEFVEARFPIKGIE